MRNLPARPCVFGFEGCSDCFYHYAQCPVIWHAFTKLGIVGSRHIDSKLRFLLLLEGDKHIILRLAFLHSCMISVHKLRGPHSGTVLAYRERYLRGNFRDTVSCSQVLKDAFNSLWKDRHANGAI